MTCRGCGRNAETRLGWCFDCAHNGERRAACRSVIQHLDKAIQNIGMGRYRNMLYDLKWAWQRLTRTGDYAKDGYFDSQGHQWR